MSASPFDALAADYDAAFTDSAIGGLMRRAVWRRADVAFRPGQRVLELNCGTGEDAAHMARRGVHVLATDVAQGMLAVAGAKLAALGLEHLVQLAPLDLDALGGGPAPALPGAPFDGALSNFGGLNCVADLGGLAAGLARLLRPGAPALLCVMGPLAPWEWAWYLGRGDLRRATRRLRPGGVAWRGLTIRYPAPGALRRAFGPWFVCRRLSAVGALLPPSYAEGWARRRPALLHALAQIERRLEAAPPLPWLADHYLIELERRPDPPTPRSTRP
jgi:SAM-dependent methyltransferase